MKTIKKLIFASLIILFLTGCEASYSITIKDNEVIEEFSAISYDSNTWDIEDEDGWSLKKEFLTNYEENTPSIYAFDISSETNERIEGVDYYEKDFYETSSEMKLTYKYTFNKEDYSNSVIVNGIFETFRFEEKDDIITINSGKNFSAFYNYTSLDNLKVSVTLVDKQVISNNADEVKGNTYIWNINRSKLDEDDNLITAMELSYNNNSIEQKVSIDLTTILIILLILAILVIIAIIFARHRMKKLEN